MTLPSLFSEFDLHAISPFFPGEAATGKPQNKQNRRGRLREPSRTDACCLSQGHLFLGTGKRKGNSLLHPYQTFLTS